MSLVPSGGKISHSEVEDVQKEADYKNFQRFVNFKREKDKP